MNEVSKIIELIQQGDETASHELLPLVYHELRALAANRMRGERKDHTLTPTALVHEAYLRLVGSGQSDDWSGMGHFFAAAAEAMRRILIDHARGKHAEKRGGNGQRLELIESWIVESANRDELLELDESLKRLELADPAAANVVKLRFFVGMTNEQAAKALDCSPRKADMLWAYSRSWLKQDLSKE